MSRSLTGSLGLYSFSRSAELPVTWAPLTSSDLVRRQDARGMQPWGVDLA